MRKACVGLLLVAMFVGTATGLRCYKYSLVEASDTVKAETPKVENLQQMVQTCQDQGDGQVPVCYRVYEEAGSKNLIAGCGAKTQVNCKLFLNLGEFVGAKTWCSECTVVSNTTKFVSFSTACMRYVCARYVCAHMHIAGAPVYNSSNCALHRAQRLPLHLKICNQLLGAHLHRMTQRAFAAIMSVATFCNE
jgi:hypothetical protein